jgi:hypothetical protein
VLWINPHLPSPFERERRPTPAWPLENFLGEKIDRHNGWPLFRPIKLPAKISKKKLARDLVL